MRISTSDVDLHPGVAVAAAANAAARMSGRAIIRARAWAKTFIGQ